MAAIASDRLSVVATWHVRELYELRYLACATSKLQPVAKYGSYQECGRPSNARNSLASKMIHK